MSALKDIYTPVFIDSFVDIIAPIVPKLDRKKFHKEIFNKEWQSKELKQRMRHIATVLHQFLHDDFNKAAKQIEKIAIKHQQAKIKENLFAYMFLPDYIEVYGLNHYNASVKAIEVVTQFVSCEYAVRPLILKYKETMMQQMLTWSTHKNHHVRRLATEGCRPRLPWAIGIPAFKENPASILPILEHLKNDPSKFVRLSVANNLNDIAKDNPAVVAEIAKRWRNISDETDAIIKHGCRTLLKQGHEGILKYFGLANNNKFALTDFHIKTPIIKIGEDLMFSFAVQNNTNQEQLFRLEYGIHYLRQNGQLSKKVFKISERYFAPNESAIVTRKQSFKVITTRKFYPGEQQLSIILNGHERVNGQFILKC